MPRRPSKHSLFPGAYELIPAATQPHIRVPEDDTPADTTIATRSIGNVTLTLTETTDYQVTASITVDLTGTDVQTAEVTAIVELLWTGFLTVPIVAPA